MNEWLGYFEMVVFTYYIVVRAFVVTYTNQETRQWLVWV